MEDISLNRSKRRDAARLAAKRYAPNIAHVVDSSIPRRCRVLLPRRMRFLFKPSRYKVLYGGRGSAKSWSIATYILLRCLEQPELLVLCARELQKSIDDSVHALLKDRIRQLGLDDYFFITRTRITCVNGSAIFYSGLRDNIKKIKSMEGVDIVWVEEAETVSDDSWEVLIPTIRKAGSEIVISFNPDQEEDPVYERFVVNRPPSTLRRFVSWRDNPWFNEVLDQERRYLEKIDPEAYQHVYEGKCRKISGAQIFRERYSVEVFEAPEGAIFLGGADWGFSQDPTACTRMYLTSEPSGIVGVPDIEELWITHEAWGIGIEIDETPALFDAEIPHARSLPMLADSARPETISYMRRQGFRISKADKWEGCVEDGVAHMKGFKRIHIHQRCRHTRDEFKLYSFKVDKKTKKILPIIVDANNHCIDSIRYALSKFVRRRGVSREWEKV